jgi:hypothetical protein
MSWDVTRWDRYLRDTPRRHCTRSIHTVRMTEGSLALCRLLQIEEGWMKRGGGSGGVRGRDKGSGGDRGKGRRTVVEMG